MKTNYIHGEFYRFKVKINIIMHLIDLVFLGGEKHSQNMRINERTDRVL